MEKDKIFLKFMEINVELLKPLLSKSTEERAQFMASCIAGLQLLLNSVPEEWKSQWDKLEVNPQNYPEYYKDRN